MPALLGRRLTRPISPGQDAWGGHASPVPPPRAAANPEFTPLALPPSSAPEVAPSLRGPFVPCRSFWTQHCQDPPVA